MRKIYFFRFLISSFFILLVLFIINGCNKIEPPYKENIISGSNTGNKLRKILLEDYTGHRCGNCPRAAKEAHKLDSIYGEQLIVISVHAGGFANPTNPNLDTTMVFDFRTSTGTELDNFFGISAAGNPNGMINRIDYPSLTHIKAYSDWSTIIDTMVAQAPTTYLTINNNYDASTRTLNTNIKTEFLQLLSSSYKLAVYITEDSIVKPQLDYDLTPDTVYNYLHRHALRGAINSTWGDVISSSGNIAPGDTIVKNYSFTLNNAWNDSHCAVIAFVYDAATYEIIQVEEKSVK